ncbi:hypothetical protein, partial [Proteus mirabilis]|uniref:hypothetical protein n=1 Tax=Proteus mirabilis TaxID=584 RepID=UPI0019508907
MFSATLMFTSPSASCPISEVIFSLMLCSPAPYAIDLQYSGSNKYEREPLDVLLRPYISGGHPRDRISTRV